MAVVGGKAMAGPHFGQKRFSRTIFSVEYAFFVLALDIFTRVIFYVRRIGLYLYKYRIYSIISIYVLKGLASVYQQV